MRNRMSESLKFDSFQEKQVVLVRYRKSKRSKLPEYWPGVIKANSREGIVVVFLGEKKSSEKLQEKDIEDYSSLKGQKIKRELKEKFPNYRKFILGIAIAERIVAKKIKFNQPDELFEYARKDVRDLPALKLKGILKNGKEEISQGNELLKLESKEEKVTKKIQRPRLLENSQISTQKKNTRGRKRKSLDSSTQSSIANGEEKSEESSIITVKETELNINGCQTEEFKKYKHFYQLMSDIMSYIMTFKEGSSFSSEEEILNKVIKGNYLKTEIEKIKKFPDCKEFLQMRGKLSDTFTSILNKSLHSLNFNLYFIINLALYLDLLVWQVDKEVGLVFQDITKQIKAIITNYSRASRSSSKYPSIYQNKYHYHY